MTLHAVCRARPRLVRKQTLVQNGYGFRNIAMMNACADYRCKKQRLLTTTTATNAITMTKACAFLCVVVLL